MILHLVASRRWAVALVVGLLGLLIGTPSENAAWGQAPANPQRVTPPKSASSKKKEELPAPKDLMILTGDGVELNVTYYASLKGKDAVPVILLHMLKGSRADYAGLGLYLQQQGHAVLAVDLRGHGGSTEWANSDNAIKLDTMRPDDYRRMVTMDMEACKAFLMQKNNAGELNIEKLCVVGAELGAAVAMEWARMDWSWPPLATVKQGQDVKALVLLSPKWTVEGLQLKDALGSPAVRETLNVMILVGKDDPDAFREAKRLEQSFKRYHPEPPREKAAEKKTFFFGSLATKLQGTKLLEVQGLKTEAHIAQFIDLRLVKKPFPWRERTTGLPK